MSAATGDADHPTDAAHTASFRESRRILELYAEAIAGRHVELRTTDDLPDLSAHVRRDLPTSSARCVFLPATVEDFATARENFAIYKLAILHQLGFWDCGTYSFSLAAAAPAHRQTMTTRGPTSRRSSTPSPVPRSRDNCGACSKTRASTRICCAGTAACGARSRRCSRRRSRNGRRSSCSAAIARGSRRWCSSA